MKISIIIPCFNEEKTIAEMLKRVSSVDFGTTKTEIIVVNDGSTDATESELTNIKSKIPHLTVIHHKKNKGKGAAVVTGMKSATGDIIAIQDADLEYDPQFLPKLVKPILEKKAKVVYGTRLKRAPNLKKDERNPLFLSHYFGNKFLSFVTSVLYGQNITDMETCYKLFPRDALKNIKIKARGFEFEPEITAKLLKKGFHITEIPITTTPRGYGEGKKLHTVRDGIKALWTLVKYRVGN